MASGLIDRKRQLPQHVGAGNKHKNGYNPDWKADFPWHVPVNDSSDSEATALSVFFVESVNDTGQNRETMLELELTGLARILGEMFCNDIESHPCTGKSKNWREPG